VFAEEEGVGGDAVLGIGLALVVEVEAAALQIFSGLAVGGAKAAGDE